MEIGDAFARAFDTRLIEATTSNWEFWYGLLERFAAARDGDARVPKEHVEDDGSRLGQWAHVQRQLHGTGSLSDERAARLEALPGWTWKPFDASWEEGYATLGRFVARNNHTRVPFRYVDEDGYPLGRWVGRQRKTFRAGLLSVERVARLEALPGWYWSLLEIRWERGYALLERFVAHEGHARVPQEHMVDGFPLGRWVGTQRHEHGAGRLSDQRKVRLQEVPGWYWNLGDDSWEKGYAALQRFVAPEGHALVPQKYEEDGDRLGIWVAKQRAAHREGQISPKRISRLEAVPGWEWMPGKGRGWFHRGGGRPRSAAS